MNSFLANLGLSAKMALAMKVASVKLAFSFLLLLTFAFGYFIRRHLRASLAELKVQNSSFPQYVPCLTEAAFM